MYNRENPRFSTLGKLPCYSRAKLRLFLKITSYIAVIANEGIMIKNFCITNRLFFVHKLRCIGFCYDLFQNLQTIVPFKVEDLQFP